MAGPTFLSLADAVEVYYDELRRFVMLRTKSASLAEEVVQETWIRASTTGAVMPDNPRAYLYRMAGHLAVDHMRRNRAHSRTVADEPLPEGLPCTEPSPEDTVGARQELLILSQAIDELPDKCRQVFLLYRGHGLTMREIAERLDISPKTVEKHVARGMVACRQKLREAGRDL